MDCEVFFTLGERYLFFAIVAKSGGDGFYHPQVCNWTSPLRSNRVATSKGVSLRLEDLIVREQVALLAAARERGLATSGYSHTREAARQDWPGWAALRFHERAHPRNIFGRRGLYRTSVKT